MSDWLSLLPDALAHEPALVRVALASVLGSAPRETGASMLVGAESLRGSIGGGNLEFKATEMARAMLRQGLSWEMTSFPLGPALGQCCGGFVELWFERIEAEQRAAFAALEAARNAAGSERFLATLASPDQAARRSLVGHGPSGGFGDPALDAWARDKAAAMQEEEPPATARVARSGGWTLLLERLDVPDTPLYLFGAGHVGRALVSVLSGLPFQVTWVDGRNGVFPDVLPANVTAHASLDPPELVRHAPPGACFLVLTHSHALDYEICREVLRRDSFSFAGLIGSHTKAARFAHRLARDAIAADRVGRLVCPIGIAGIAAKQPEAIAVAVAAQLLRLRELGWDAQAAHERGRPASARAGAPAESGRVVPITVHPAQRES
jgi:xanthine dehydrogenase accessory factor